MLGSLDHDLEFRCPRCGQAATARFYGPCAACREELVASFSTDSSGEEAVVAARFEPGMHVVPNHVATKD